MVDGGRVIKRSKTFIANELGGGVQRPPEGVEIY